MILIARLLNRYYNLQNSFQLKIKTTTHLWIKNGVYPIFTRNLSELIRKLKIRLFLIA
jgi:hypothetical protein